MGNVLIQGSSNVWSIEYTEDTLTLRIQYKTKKGEPGLVYDYPGVPSSLHEDLMTAESKGKFLARVIKPNFPAQRVID